MKLRLLLFSAFVAAGALWVLAGAHAREAKAAKIQPGLARATFAGGCFWCMEPPFEKIPGVAVRHLGLRRRPASRTRATSRSRRAAPGTPSRCRSSTTRRA